MTVRLRLSLPELSVWRFQIHVWKILLAVKTPWVMVIRVSVGPGPQYAYVDSSTFFQYGCLAFREVLSKVMLGYLFVAPFDVISLID